MSGSAKKPFSPVIPVSGSDEMKQTKRRLCLTWGFVLCGEADPEEETSPGVYR